MKPTVFVASSSESRRIARKHEDLKDLPDELVPEAYGQLKDEVRGGAAV